MPPFLARLGDFHLCPMVTPVPGAPPVPHVGGPIIGPGVVGALLGGVPLSVLGDFCYCNLIPDSVSSGVITAIIFGRPATMLGSVTIHGGVVSQVSPMTI